MSATEKSKEETEGGKCKFVPSATATGGCTSTTAHRGSRINDDDAFGVPVSPPPFEFLEPPPSHAQSSIRRFCQSVSQSVSPSVFSPSGLTVWQSERRGEGQRGERARSISLMELKEDG